MNTFERYWRIQAGIAVANDVGDAIRELALLEEQRTLPEYQNRNRVRK